MIGSWCYTGPMLIVLQVITAVLSAFMIAGGVYLVRVVRDNNQLRHTLELERHARHQLQRMLVPGVNVEDVEVNDEEGADADG